MISKIFPYSITFKKIYITRSLPITLWDPKVEVEVVVVVVMVVHVVEVGRVTCVVQKDINNINVTATSTTFNKN